LPPFSSKASPQSSIKSNYTDKEGQGDLSYDDEDDDLDENAKLKSLESYVSGRGQSSEF
jgi:hypothetical protein